MGIDHKPQGWVWGRGLRPTYLLYYVIHGVVWSEDQTARVSPGEVLCVPPRVPKRLMATEGDVRAAYLHMADADPWTVLPGDDYSVHPAGHARLVYDSIETLQTEVLAKTPQAVEAAEYLSQLLLHYLRRLVNVTESPQDMLLRSRLIDLWNRVAENVSSDWSVSVLAEKVHMSEGHFHREVQRLFGEKPMQIVRRLRMERAAALLKTTSLDLEGVAEQVGYSTPYTFSNAFVREMGVRPGKYQRSKN